MGSKADYLATYKPLEVIIDNKDISNDIKLAMITEVIKSVLKEVETGNTPN